MKVEIDNVSFGYSSTPVLKGISVKINGPQFISIIGPNGVGKSTLIHCINKILSPNKGAVFIDDVNVKDIPLKELAKEVGYVPYTSSDSFPLTVVDTVLMGRHPHAKLGSKEEDLRKVYEVLKELEIVDLALRPFDELSAGQHQKVVLARGLVQEPRILLLDEPTSNLDIHHQLEVIKTLKKLSHDKQILIIMISHDLNIAAKYADNMILLYKGGIFAVGRPKDVITKEALRVVYHVDADIMEYDGCPYVVIRDSFKDEDDADWQPPEGDVPVLELRAGTEE